MTDYSKFETAAECAAQWWTDKLRAPGRYDNGDTDPFRSMLQAVLVEKIREADGAISDEALATFRESLRRRIHAAINQPALEHGLPRGTYFVTRSRTLLPRPDYPAFCLDPTYVEWEYRTAAQNAEYAAFEAACDEIDRRGRMENIIAGAPWSLCIQVDYHPDQILVDALEDAGLAKRAGYGLPIRTVLHVQGNDVTMGPGYGSKLVSIWRRP